MSAEYPATCGICGHGLESEEETRDHIGKCYATDIDDAKRLAGHAQTVGLERDDPLILELADAVMALVKEMNLRELHHFETERELGQVWDEVGGVLQTPAGGLTGDEYRAQVIRILAERGEK